MTVARGAFGVARQGREAVGDQSWIEESHKDFQGWSRKTLDTFYPALASSPEAMQSRCPGVVHVWCRSREFWHVCLTFRPTFSSARLVPMWLIARVPASDFRGGMLLEGIVGQLVETARVIESGSAGGEAWLRRRDPEAGSQAGLEEFRAALAIDRWPSGEPVDFMDSIVLRAIQLRLEAELDAVAADASPRIWASLRPTRERLAESNQGARVIDLGLGSAKLPVEPAVIRGVRDTTILAGTPPHRVLAEAVAARARQRNGSLDGHVRVPLELLGREAVREHEITAWAGIVARDANRTEREIFEIVRAGGESVSGSSRMLAALLCRTPEARRGDLHATCEMMEKAGLASMLSSAGSAGSGAAVEG